MTALLFRVSMVVLVWMVLENTRVCAWMALVENTAKMTSMSVPVIPVKTEPLVTITSIATLVLVPWVLVVLIVKQTMKIVQQVRV